MSCCIRAKVTKEKMALLRSYIMIRPHTVVELPSASSCVLQLFAWKIAVVDRRRYALATDMLRELTNDTLAAMRKTSQLLRKRVDWMQQSWAVWRLAIQLAALLLATSVQKRK